MRANPGDKMVACCIDDADVPCWAGSLRTGARWVVTVHLDIGGTSNLPDLCLSPGPGQLTVRADSGFWWRRTWMRRLTRFRPLLRLTTERSFFASYGDGGGNPGTGGRPSAPRRDRERHPRPQVRRGVEPFPSGRFPANAAWLAVQVIAHNLARWRRASVWASRSDHQDPATPLLFHGGRLTRSARRLTVHLALALGSPVQWRPR